MTVGVTLVEVGVAVGLGVGYDITMIGPSIVVPLEFVTLITTSSVGVSPLGVLIFGTSVYISVVPSGYVTVPPEEVGSGVIITSKQLIILTMKVLQSMS